MLMILARLVRSESFWAVAKVRSPHTGPGIRYIIEVVCPPAAEPQRPRVTRGDRPTGRPRVAGGEGEQKSE